MPSPADVIAELARDHRLLVIVIPDGVDQAAVLALKAEVDARLEALVAERDAGRPDA